MADKGESHLSHAIGHAEAFVYQCAAKDGADKPVVDRVVQALRLLAEARKMWVANDYHSPANMPKQGKVE